MSMTPLNVLIIEDDAVIAMVLADMLAEMDHFVCAIAATEADAVAAATRHKPGLMIVDALLRNGNGMSAVDTITQRGPIPHVFVSGASVDVDRPESEVLQKPFLERELVQAIQRVLGVVAACPVDKPQIMTDGLPRRRFGEPVPHLYLAPTPDGAPTPDEALTPDGLLTPNGLDGRAPEAAVPGPAAALLD